MAYKSIAQGRKTGGFSLRRSLEDQGVTTEQAMVEHLGFVNDSLKVNPRLDITRYRVNPNTPNAVSSAMG